MKESAAVTTELDESPAQVADRYDVLESLGRGGTAVALRVKDRVTGKEIALKRLLDERRGDRTVVELFEREFHTLTQLAHPRVVRAFDYGIDRDEVPYYTMELLDGGDLRGLAPLPWQEACMIAYEICSALSLLHSRRLVHRDLTPRNVRRTSDGKAKLIDFGLLSPFGPGALLAGTPPYVAPELVNKTSLDGRSDLFSLGATLYYALTGRVAFPARRFEQLRDLWRGSPPPPGRLVADIPPALDQLVMALLRVNMASRPKSAAEVMERLRPLLQRTPDADLKVAHAYLAAPQLVGRSEAITRLRKQAVRAVRGRGGSFLLVGPSGSGRTRMLDAFVLESKLLGAATARVSASDAATGPFGAAQAVMAQLHEAMPNAFSEVARELPEVADMLFGTAAPQADAPLRSIAQLDLPRGDIQQGLRRWVQHLADQHLVAIAVDDIEVIDEPSAAFVATLGMHIDRHRLTLAVTAQLSSLTTPNQALSVLREHSHFLDVEPLASEEMLQLVRGLFGDVPNLQRLAHRLSARADGLPRECMLLAQHLVDHEYITYEGGDWVLPELIPEEALPSREDVVSRQLVDLSSGALEVARLLALSVVPNLSRHQLLAVTGMGAAELEQALAELQELRLVAVGAGHATLSQVHMKPMLLDDVSSASARVLHDKLVHALEQDEGRALLTLAHHGLQGEHAEAMLDRVFAASPSIAARTALVEACYSELGGRHTTDILYKALQLARELGRPEHERILLWSSMCGVAAAGEATERFYEVGPHWLRLLKRDSGWNDWQELAEVEDPQGRAIQAFIKATERYQATPEDERIADPTESIKDLVSYVVFGIAVGARGLDMELLDSLPGVLEPFVTLNPMVAAMHDNAVATVAYGRGQRQRARRLFWELLKRLEGVETTENEFLEHVRAALMVAVKEASAALGMPTPDVGEMAPDTARFHSVTREYLLKIEALHRGDWEAAEGHRQRAELIALQNRLPAMFPALVSELEVHTLARELTGLRGVRNRVARMAELYPSWRCVGEAADAAYHFLCGEHEQALRLIEKARTAPELLTAAGRGRALPLVEMLEVEALTELGRVEEAVNRGLALVQECDQYERAYARRALHLSLAVAEAKLGRFDDAHARIDIVAKEQDELGVIGLLRGRCAEYRARVALLQGDRDAFGEAAAEAAKDYVQARGSVLGALYDRLMEEARKAEVGLADAAITEVDTAILSDDLDTLARTTLVDSDTPRARAEAALRLLCSSEPPLPGHLFLLTDEGLTLLASNREVDNRDALQAFAQVQLEFELDDDVCTMTGALEEEEEELEMTRTLDESGVRYTSIPLLTRKEGDLYVLGVALISDSMGSREHMTAVAAAIAKQLIQSGDYQPLLAA